MDPIELFTELKNELNNINKRVIAMEKQNIELNNINKRVIAMEKQNIELKEHIAKLIPLLDIMDADQSSADASDAFADSDMFSVIRGTQRPV